MNSKKFITVTAVFTVLLLICVAVPIIVFDPFFHYHKPLENYNYNVYDQRYSNDGIIRNFDYDAMIIGTSMTDNFRTTDMDAWYGTKSIKVPFDGASYKEIDRFICKAAKENENLKIVVRGLDFVNLYHEKDYMQYDESLYPNYLYNYNIFDDVKYVLDKEVLFTSTLRDVYFYTRSGSEKFNFDDYSAWYQISAFGKEATLATYQRPEMAEEKAGGEAFWTNLEGNITQNVMQTAKENPDITFYYFYTPYSILYFDREMRAGRLELNIDLAEKATEMMLECENIRLYSFFDLHEIICNLDIYKDIIHYNENINSRILKWMLNGTGLLTKENYKEHFDGMRQFYLNYDYDAIFE